MNDCQCDAQRDMNMSPAHSSASVSQKAQESLASDCHEVAIPGELVKNTWASYCIRMFLALPPDAGCKHSLDTSVS